MNLLKARLFRAGVVVYLFVQVWSAAWATVWVDIYLQDGITPLEPADPCELFDWSQRDQVFTYKSIPIGQRLVFVISSDEALQWSGGLLMEVPGRNRGLFSCRREDGGLTANCDESSLPAAGNNPSIFYVEDVDVNGIMVYSDWNASPGEWFEFDFEAIAGGECVIGFYDFVDHGPNPGFVKINDIRLTHVPDLNGDHIVDICEYAIVSRRWGSSGCPGPERCGRADANGDFVVDMRDIQMLSQFWLEQTE